MAIRVGREDNDFVPQFNGYHCSTCGKSYLTVDLAEGVTPMFMSCLRTEGCPGRATSMGYPAGPPPAGIPLLIEWVRPAREDLRKMKNPALQNHFRAGGLMRRAVPDAPDWVKKLV